MKHAHEAKQGTCITLCEGLPNSFAEILSRIHPLAPVAKPLGVSMSCHGPNIVQKTVRLTIVLVCHRPKERVIASNCLGKAYTTHVYAASATK